MSVSNLNSKASLTYFLQYFASISAYTGAVACIQRQKKAMIRIYQCLYPFLDYACMRASLWSTGAPKMGTCRVASASAETVQCVRSQNS